MIAYWYHLDALWPILVWAAVLAVTMVGVCASVLALRFQRRWMVYLSSSALGAALIIANIPTRPAPALVTALLTIAVLAFAVLGGGPAAMLVLALASRGSVAIGSHGGIVVASAAADAPATARREVLRGGTTIGFLERFATAGAIVAGFPAALAVIVAVKGVGRFTELDAAESRERFIIGTLVSLIWACACAAIAHAVG
ncbi:MAG: hypothetical protein ABI255_05140 [Microbacteriaceae bacterium]